jgi:zinc transporter ZupT
VHLVDGGVYLAVPLLVAFQVLPHAWEDRSVLALAALVAGFLLPALIERASHALEERTDNVALVVGLSGVVLHAVLEGGAFAAATEGPEAPFALAVTLHRIPVGLVIWWLIRPRFGIGWAVAGVGSMVVGTLGGYALGAELLSGLEASGIHLYQAFVSGSLVHVVYHQGRHDHDHPHDHGHYGHTH